MFKAQDAAPPPLQPPGTGLPKVELFIARLLVRRGLRRATRQSSTSLFASEQTAINALVDACDPATAARRVLIPRPRGLEDSSRFWSVYMTLDHLRIVNDGIGRVIEGLARGQAPARPTGTADVKPSPEADAGAVEAFGRACAGFEQRVAAVDDLRTAARAPHPWFGPQDGAGWHYFAGMHMGLHRVQIESILRTAAAADDEPVRAGAR